MTTVKDLAKEYVDTYCKGQPGYEGQADLQEAYDDMVYHFLYDLANECCGTVHQDSDTPLTEEQEKFVRDQFKEYADND